MLVKLAMRPWCPKRQPFWIAFGTDLLPRVRRLQDHLDLRLTLRVAVATRQNRVPRVMKAIQPTTIRQFNYRTLIWVCTIYKVICINFFFLKQISDINVFISSIVL